MTRNEYIRELASALTALPRAGRREVLDDIARHFDDGAAQGLGEAELCRQLGAAKALADGYLEEHAARTGKAVRTRGPWSGFWAALGLCFINLIIVLPVYLGLLGAYAGLVASAFAMALGGFAAAGLGAALLVVPTLIAYTGNPLVALLGGIGVCALGLLFLLLLWHLGRWFFRATGRYIQANRNVIQGRRDAR